ncbi:MAG: tRNA (N(6)-L-threonylcarbamoyladenosine(37)-C(2))-methylthiotransferase MtaB [Anaerolineae bacterium]
MDIYLTALGCKLNQAEIEALARRAEALGHRVVGNPKEAQWAIVNTCAVTHVAARKSRQLVRRLSRQRPGLRIALIGCYADISSEEASALAGVEFVLANYDKEECLARILDPQTFPPGTVAATSTRAGHTRAMVKIQDGCDNHCTYCVVRVARGPQRSRLPRQVLDEVRARLDEGHQEIVLTGVHIGAYGRDSAPGAALPPSADWSLARLVRLLLDESATSRLRLSSIEPWDLTPELLQVWRDPRVCRHVHLPLQSGCDATLLRMGRSYDTPRIAALVKEVREQMPDVTISTDVIVGFPGETEAEFETTLAFIENLRLARLHVFPFSPRPGTPALLLPGRVDPGIARARARRLIALGQRLAEQHHQRFVGRDVQVLFETAHEGESATGLTDNYLRVRVSSGAPSPNTLCWVRCERASSESLEGVLLSTEMLAGQAVDSSALDDGL